MNRNEPQSPAAPPRTFTARPMAPRAVPASVIDTAPTAATPIYDRLVAECGDPYSRLGPTRARLLHLGDATS